MDWAGGIHLPGSGFIGEMLCGLVKSSKDSGQISQKTKLGYQEVVLLGISKIFPECY